MTNAVLGAHSRDAPRYARSWGLSLFIHGLAVGAAVLVMGDWKPAPVPEPFQWNVTLVEPPPQPVARPTDSREQAKPAPQATTAPSPKREAPQPEAPQPVERQARIVEAVPLPQSPPAPAVPRQEPMSPVVEHKPEPEVTPEPKPEIKPVLKDVQPEGPPPTPVVAKPVEPAEPVAPPVQHQPHHIGTPSDATHTPPAEAVVEHASAQASPHPSPHPSSHAPSSHAEPVPSHPAPSAPPAPPAPLVASVAPSAPAPPIPSPVVQESVPAPSAAPSAAPIQEAAATASPTPAGAGRHQAKADFGWVGKALWDRVMNLKRYPLMARARHLEGRVVVRAVIRDDGHLAKVDVAESSGHDILDQDAIEVLRRAFPLKFTQPLGQPEVVVQIPISYKLH